MNIEGLNKLAELNSAQSTDDDEDDDFDLEEQAICDIRAAIELFATTRTLLEFLATPDLIKNITKREREMLLKMSERIRRFVGDVEPTYSEDET